MLVVIVAVGSIGINILSYCCNHKEVSLLTSIEFINNTHSHSHNTHNVNCCASHAIEIHSCCLNDHNHIDADNAEEQYHTAQHCTKSDFMQLKPVKTTDYTIAYCALQPIIIQLFDFIPEVETNTTPRFSNDEQPPGDCGRDILAKNAILRI